MKKFLRTLALVLTLVFSLSSVAFSAFAAEFTDYYETPEYYFGDTDFDGRITVKDATALQKHLAKIITLSEDALYFGDVDGNGKNTISDATLIQKYVANMINIFPVEDVGSYYEYTADGTTLDVEFMTYGFAEIQVTVEESGFYDFSATVVEGSDIYFDVTNENMENHWFSESDGESSYVFAKLEAGVYYVYISTFGEIDAVVQFKAGLSEHEAPFDIDKAVELNIGDRIDVKSGETPLVYKVDITNIETEGDELCVFTEGEDPRVTLMCYDEYFSVNNEGIFDDDGNVALNVYDDGVNTVYYVVVKQQEGGSDFTLCCDTAFGILKSEAKDIELGTVDEIEVVDFVDEYDGEEYISYFAEAIYRFVPDESGYYSLNFESDAPMYVMAIVANLNAVDESYIYVDMNEEGGKLYDVCKLQGGYEYYIIGMVYLDTEGSLSFSVQESNEEEYQLAQQNNPFLDATEDEIEPTKISVGDTVSVEFTASADEFATKDFVFTAEEDCTVVLYSENSVDAVVYVLDSDLMTLHMGDDIPLFESLDFAVIGTVAKGETVYFSLASYSETGDSFTFTIVNEADYTPLG